MSADPTAPPAGTIACPRCGQPVGPDQDWCLNCGAAARTRLAPTPNWRLPIAGLALVVALAGVALAVAFVTLTGNSDTPSQTITTTAPAAAPPTTAAPATTAPPPTTTTAPPSAPAATAAPNAPTPTQTAPGG